MTTTTETESISAENIRARGEPLLEGLLYKLQLHPGAGAYVPENSEVELELRMLVGGQPVIEYSQKPLIKQLERILPTGLSKAVSTMRRGERALVWMDSCLAFGAATLLLKSDVKLQKESNLIFEVKLNSWVDEVVPPRLQFRQNYSVEALPKVKEAIEEAETVKRQGRKFEALRRFRSSLYHARRLRIDAEKSPKEEEERRQLEFYLAARTAECALETGKYPMAVTLSKEALEISPFDAYVSYICGCAYFSLGFLRSATKFLRAAHHNDLRNEAYEKKLREIEKHQALLEKDIDVDSDKEEYEDFAAHCRSKIVANEKKLKKQVGTFINDRIQEGAREAIVGGGFRPEFLKRISDKIIDSKQQIYVINTADDVLELKF